MNLDPSLLPGSLLWPSSALVAVAIALHLLKAPWRLLADNRLEPVFISAVGCIALLWFMRAGVRPGLELHLLGCTALTLIFGRHLAVAAGVAALLVVTAIGDYAWEAFALNALLLVLLPVLVSHQVGRAVYRWLPHHFFVYIFLAAFVGAMLALGAVVLTSAAVFYALGTYPGHVIVHDYLVMLPLILFPEGFITGMVMTMLVVFRPDWVRTFDDRDYIQDR